MHYMSKPRADGDAGSIVLIASTSGYFGGTGVGAYVASKHGVIGLLRACQGVAIRRGIRVNAVAPFFTPTQITAGYAQQWKDSGLEANTPETVAEEIYRVSVEPTLTGECSMVSLLFLFFFCLTYGLYRSQADLFTLWSRQEQPSSRLL